MSWFLSCLFCDTVVFLLSPDNQSPRKYNKLVFLGRHDNQAIRNHNVLFPIVTTLGQSSFFLLSHDIQTLQVVFFTIEPWLTRVCWQSLGRLPLHNVLFRKELWSWRTYNQSVFHTLIHIRIRNIQVSPCNNSARTKGLWDWGFQQVTTQVQCWYCGC